MRTRYVGTTLLATGALLLGTTSCAKNDTPSEAAAKPRAIKAVAGCGKGSWTDPADRSPDRKPPAATRARPPRPSSASRAS